MRQNHRRQNAIQVRERRKGNQKNEPMLWCCEKNKRNSSVCLSARKRCLDLSYFGPSGLPIIPFVSSLWPPSFPKGRKKQVFDRRGLCHDQGSMMARKKEPCWERERDEIGNRLVTLQTIRDGARVVDLRGLEGARVIDLGCLQSARVIDLSGHCWWWLGFEVLY